MGMRDKEEDWFIGEIMTTLFGAVFNKQRGENIWNDPVKIKTEKEDKHSVSVWDYLLGVLKVMLESGKITVKNTRENNQNLEVPVKGSNQAHTHLRFFNAN